MPLSTCPECGKEISDRAAACPHCGNPFGPALIEATGKNWKTARVISWLVFLGGLFMFLRFLQDGGWNNPLTGLGFTLAFVGLVALLIAKFGAWWNHK
jgi:hypothetical protein